MHNPFNSSDNIYGVNHHCCLFAHSIAGGKSNLTDSMIDALNVMASDSTSVLFGKDINELIDLKLINMFSRNASGIPYLESYIIHGALRNAAGQVNRLRIITADGQCYNLGAADYINNDVMIAEDTVDMIDSTTGDVIKHGEFEVLNFRDHDGNQLVRFAEVAKNVRMSFTVNAINENDRWNIIWKQAERCGIGAARRHGYGKFSVAEWS